MPYALSPMNHIIYACLKIRRLGVDLIKTHFYCTLYMGFGKIQNLRPSSPYTDILFIDSYEVHIKIK